MSEDTHLCTDCGQLWWCGRKNCGLETSAQCPKCSDKTLEERLPHRTVSSVSAAKREARQEVLTGAFPTGRTPSKRPAFKWRAECVKSYPEELEQDVILQRLKSGLDKGRISPEGYERLEKLLEASWEDVEQAPSTF